MSSCLKPSYNGQLQGQDETYKKKKSRFVCYPIFCMALSGPIEETASIHSPIAQRQLYLSKLPHQHHHYGITVRSASLTHTPSQCEKEGKSSLRDGGDNASPDQWYSRHGNVIQPISRHLLCPRPPICCVGLDSFAEHAATRLPMFLPVRPTISCWSTSSLPVRALVH